MVGLAKRALIAMLFLLGAGVGCGASFPMLAAPKGVEVRLLVENNEMEVRVVNTGSSVAEVFNPLGLSLLPDDPGLVLAIFDHTGRPQNLCGHVEPGNRVLESIPVGGEISRRFRVEHVAQLYCLAPGRYEVRARLLLAVSPGDELDSVESLPVLVVVKRSKGSPF